MFKTTILKLRYRQMLYCLAALTSVVGGAIHGTWSSPFIPQLQSENSPIGVTLTTIQSSSVVSSFLIGSFIGCIFTLWGYDIFGRKTILILGSLSEIIAWIFIYFANSATILIIGRIIGGFSTVAILNGAIIYNAEICDKDNRGKMGFLLTVFTTSGSLTSYVVGPYVPYKIFTIIAICVSAFSILCVSFIPESPYHLIKMKQHEIAMKSIKKLCSNATTQEEVDEKLKQITKTVEHDMQNKSTIKELFTNRNFRKPLLIHWSVKILMYLSGNSIIKSYMQTIISYSGEKISASFASVIFGIFSVVSVLISSFVVDKFGRKPLLIISTTLCGICNGTLATYFYFLEETSFNLDVVSWLPLITLVAYEISVSIALLPIPYMIGAELYPMNVKGTAVSIVSLAVLPVTFLIQIAFESVREVAGTYTSFYVFTFFCFVGTVFAIFIFPETKGKSFEEIQQSLKNDKSW